MNGFEIIPCPACAVRIRCPRVARRINVRCVRCDYRFGVRFLERRRAWRARLIRLRHLARRARFQWRTRNRLSPSAMVVGLALLWLAVAGVPNARARPDAQLDAAVPAGCGAPVVWHVAHVDPRRGLSSEDVRRAVQAAADVWEAETDRTLFRHEPGRGMPIRIVWDARQKLYAELLRLEAEVELAKRRHAEWPTRATTRELNALAAHYRNAARDWKDRGNFTMAEVAGTIRQRSGRAPVIQKRLNVYAFADHAELVRLLAHELGHALGLNHLGMPDAVMYGYLDRPAARGGAPRLSGADRQALERLCLPS